MFHYLIQESDDDSQELEEKINSFSSIESNSNREEWDKHKGVIRKKIRFVAKMLKMQRILRTENETLLKIKSANNDKLPRGLLFDGTILIDTFKKIKLQDFENESRPYTDDLI